MASIVHGAREFVAGGAVQAGNGIYLTRPVDQELLELCRKGAYAYVLTSRQMGKSSLLSNTAETLAGEGVVPVMLDLSLLGSSLSLDQWYVGFLTVLEDQLQLPDPASAWWEQNRHLGPSQRFTGYLREVVLRKVQDRIVIFVDEIDNTLTLDFTDDFFVAIRYMYHARANDPAFNRLSFVLSGVATPGDLIKDNARTPFNIGQRLELRDFARKEALPLTAHLGIPVLEAGMVLDSVLSWTGGHPYLTLKVFRSFQDHPLPQYSEAAIGERVALLFFGPAGEQDSNLVLVREMLTTKAKQAAGTRSFSKDDVLAAYRQIYRKPLPDQEQDQVFTWLKLSGVVLVSDARLQVRNRIYRTVFTPEWAAAHMDFNWRRVIAKYRRYILLLLAALAVIIPLYLDARKQEARAKANGDMARANLTKETALRQEADNQRAFARQQEMQAKTALDQEQIARQDAELALQRLDKANRDLEKAKAEAVAQRQLADAQAKLAEESAAQANTASNEAKAAASKLADSNNQLRTQVERATKAENDAIAARDLAEKQFQEAETQRTRAEAVLRQIELTDRKAMGQFAAGPVLRNPPVTEGAVSSSLLGAVFDRWGQRILTYSVHIARLWKLQSGASGTLTATVDPTLGPDVDTVVFSPSDPGILAIGSSHSILLRRNQENQEIVKSSFSSGFVDSMEFSRDGSLLAVATDDVLWLFEAATGKLRNKIPLGDSLARFDVHLSPDAGSALVFNRGRLAALNLATGKQRYLADSFRATYSPDGRFILIFPTNEDYGVDLFDARGYSKLRSLKHGGVNSAVFSPDSTHVATTGFDGATRIWSVETGKLNAILKPRGPLAITAAHGKAWPLIPLSFTRERSGGFGSPRAAAYSPDGEFLATGHTDGLIRIWKTTGATGGQPQAELRGHFEDIFSLQFSCNQRYLLSSSADGTARVWDLRTVRGMKLTDSCPALPSSPAPENQTGPR